MRRWLSNARVREALGCALLASVAFQLVLDFRIVRPTAIDWIFDFYRDTAQYYLALAYFRNSAWHFPLTSMETMLHPVGASFTLADGIPLLGLPTKALSALLPIDFQYFGAWLFASMLLSAWYGKLVLNRLVTSPALRWVGTALIVLAPPVVRRFPHCHLAAHWLILAAFHSVMERRALPTRRIWALSLMSLFVQSYLFVMVSSLLAGAFWVHRRASRRVLVTAAFGWVCLVVAGFWSLGYFTLGTTVAGQSDTYYADLTAFAGSMGASSLVPMLPLGVMARAVRETPEGFAYLGLGGLCLFVALLAALVLTAVRRRAKPIFDPSFAILGLLCVAMAIYAISPSPMILGHRHSGLRVLTELLSPIVARLRAVGRFIWPLYYFVLLFGLQAADYWLSRVRVAYAQQAGALLLFVAQFADIGPWLVERGQAAALTNPRPLRRVPAALERALTPETRFLVFAPPPERLPCRAVNLGPDEGNYGRMWKRRQYYHLAVFGARHQLIVNTDFGASARITDEERSRVCRYGLAFLLAKELPPDVLLVKPPGTKAKADTKQRAEGRKDAAAAAPGERDDADVRDDADMLDE